jgi:hypothetical protein
MSRVGTWSSSPKDEYRDRADFGRVTKATSPTMVTTPPRNCPISAHTLHTCCRLGYALTNYSLKGFYTLSQHPHVICYMLTCTINNLQLASKLALYSEEIDGPLWIPTPAEDLQAVVASYSYQGQDSTLTLTLRLTQAELRSLRGNIAFSMLSQLSQALSKSPTLIVRGQDFTSTLIIPRSSPAGLRASLGNVALPALLRHPRQKLKKGPAFIFITVYRHVVMYVGLTSKGQNGTAILTDIATQAIKPSGHSHASPLAFKNLGTVSFLRSVSKLGWNLPQVFPTIGKLKLIQAAPGEPFLPFPREGVG